MGRGQGLVGRTLDLVDEEQGAVDTIDVSRIVAEEDTPEGGKGTQQVGLPGNWGLDALDIVGGAEGCDHIDRQESLMYVSMYRLRCWG